MHIINRIYVVFGFLLLLYSAHSQGKETDSLKQLLTHSKSDSATYNILRLTSWSSMWSNSDTALFYAQRALLLSKQLNDLPRESEALLLYGTAWSVIGNYPLAIDYLLKGIHIEEKLNLIRLSDVWPIPVLQLFYYNISDCYRDLGDYEHALYYYKKSITVPYKSIDNNLQEAYWHISKIYEKFNYLDSALLYGKKAFDLDVKMNGRGERLPIPIVLGDIYFKKKDYQQALSYYNLGQTYAVFEIFFKDAIGVYNGLADTYAQVNEKDSAIYYAQKALNLQKKISYPVGALKTYGILSKLYKKKGQLDSAIKYIEQSYYLQNKVFSQQNEREIQSLAFNEKLREQEVLVEQQQYRNTIRIYVALMIVTVLLIISIALWRNLQHRKKSYRVLQIQKDETENERLKTEDALIKLKSTQAQLIQSEKMASLGELTAGIAHEIQNPLNFVNNFSDVNTELLQELKNELQADNKQEAFSLADNIIENEQKINHHGHRADAIVKGMLQHSRASTGKKEPTDINALADEYLRLSYHGFRAKDKNFSEGMPLVNATIKTDFDHSIDKINIVPQDIGRVLLNLYNNAFYAVAEKKKQQPEGYEPTVSVSTKKINDRVEIIVSDNGKGIPKNIVDKIFQPFFTTKPTGQGTGLGLSLSYDIIKAHGGEINVETKEGAGSTFIITLPV